MVLATHIQPTDRALSASPIDWRMDIELHGASGKGRSPGGYPTDRLPFGASQPRDEVEVPSAASLLVRELLQHIHDLRERVEILEGRVPSIGRADPVPDLESGPTQHEFDDLDDIADAETPGTAQDDGGTRLADLPRGPLSIDAVATVLGKTVRTIRGWCQIEKYDIPCHKEGGRWHFYRDELLAWYADYEGISRRDAKCAQAKRRMRKHGKQV